MNTSQKDQLIGQTLDGRYRILSRIARGGMAVVYLADDLRLHRQVAVKVMHAHLTEDDNFTRRFEREAQCAAGLSHPNLVAVLDQGNDSGHIYLVMEYVPNMTLRELLKQQQRLTSVEATEISEAVLAGLAAAHGVGIIHRDLKPENVLLADDGRIKIGDFGLARAVSANTTTGQALLGTIAYLSPELVTRGTADERSDLYAFGIMLYEMLTGKQPFTGEQPMQIAYQHAHSEVPLPSLAVQGVAPELDELVRWCTQREPSLRPRDAREALGYLQDVHDRGFEAATQQLTRTQPLYRQLAAEGRGQGGTGETTVLPADDATAVLEGATTLLPQQGDTVAVQPAVAPAGGARGLAPASHRAAQPQSSSLAAAELRAASKKRMRARRGRALAVLSVLLIATASFCGWWFGSGPGSLVTVPSLTGSAPDDAKAQLTELTLTANFKDCPSLTVESGVVSGSTPKAGSRVERESTVSVCVSSGPRQLPVPQLVGLTEKAAREAINSAKFKVGKVLEQRFDAEAPAGTVLAALAANGDALGTTYSEQGRIDLIVSAGPLPDVSGMTVANARGIIEKLGLVYDESLNNSTSNEEVEKGRALAVVPSTDPVKVGDSVGLTLSTGPELFAIPNVADLGLQEAMDKLAAAGFKPTTLVPDALRGFSKATGTDPAAGTKVKKGTEVRVKATVAL